MSQFLFFLLIFFSSLSPALFSNKTPYTEVLDSPLLVNLARHSFRYETTKKLMEEAGFTNIIRFEAIDGYTTEQQLFEELNIHHRKPGVKGCAASHLIIWRDHFQNPDSKEFLFVCEDDVLPHSLFAELFPLYWEQTPDDFDIVFVGNSLKDKWIKGKDLVIKCPTTRTHAYIISKKGAKKLYDLHMQLGKSDLNLHEIDHFLCNTMRYHKIEKFYCYVGQIYPDLINQEKGLIRPHTTGLCFQNNALGTTIRH